MEAENTHKKPVTPGEDGLSTPFFTPDSGVNDTCGGAIALTENMPYTMNTAQATTAGDPVPSNCDYNPGKGVWFTYTPGERRGDRADLRQRLCHGVERLHQQLRRARANFLRLSE